MLLRIKIFLISSAILFITNANCSEIKRKKSKSEQYNSRKKIKIEAKSESKNICRLDDISDENYIEQAMNTPGISLDIQKLIASYTYETFYPKFPYEGRTCARQMLISPCGKYLALHTLEESGNSWERLFLIKLTDCFKKEFNFKDFVIYKYDDSEASFQILKFSGDGRYLFYCCNFCIFKFDLFTKKEDQILKIDFALCDIKYSNCGNYLFFDLGDNLKKIFNLNSKKFIDKLDKFKFVKFDSGFTNGKILKNGCFEVLFTDDYSSTIELRLYHLLCSVKSCIYCKKEESKEHKNFACHNCKSVYYCSKACQEFDLKRHKEFCKSKQT